MQNNPLWSPKTECHWNKLKGILIGNLFYIYLLLAGKMKGLAFIQDPDGYWIEILSPNNMVSITS